MAADDKNYLNDISQSVGIILLALSSFMGMLYMRKGDIILTSIIILIGVLALFGTVFLLWKAKEAKRNKGFNLQEVLLLVLAISIALSAYIPIFHFSNLEFNAKNQIKYLGGQIAQEIRGLPDEFDKQAREAMTRMEIRMQNDGKEQSSIDARKESVNKILDLTKRNLQVDSESISQDELTINAWNRLQLNQAFYNLDETYKKHITALEEGMRRPTVEEWPGEFVYERSFKQGEIITSPRALVNNSNFEVNYLIPLVVCLFCLLLILVPYFRQKRGLVWRDDLHDVD